MFVVRQRQRHVRVRPWTPARCDRNRAAFIDSRDITAGGVARSRGSLEARCLRERSGRMEGRGNELGDGAPAASCRHQASRRRRSREEEDAGSGHTIVHRWRRFGCEIGRWGWRRNTGRYEAGLGTAKQRRRPGHRSVGCERRSGLNPWPHQHYTIGIRI
jgi:hypothetical protein